MRIIEFLRNLWPWPRRQYQQIYVKTQEQADAINGVFSIPDEVFLRVTKLIEPSYGRLATFEFDTNDPDGKKAFEWMKIISQFNGNGYADIRIGDNYITFEFKDYQNAEAMRGPWEKLEDIKKIQEMIKKQEEE